MGMTVSSLQAAGMVCGKPDPVDGRQTLLSLTHLSREWLARDHAARQDWLSRAIGGRLSPAEQDKLAAALPLLNLLIQA